MALVTQTPGVYIQEVSKLPPSVAQVATAIPVFIGFTEKAIDLVADDLIGKATRITSMRQYELLFGGPPKQGFTIELIDVLLPDGVTTKKMPLSASISTPSDYRMYHALQLYFSNGGGPCYIIPVAKTTTAITKAELEKGIPIAEAVDEITLYLFPDAAKLAAGPYYGVYQTALDNCAKLQDRFTIVDVKSNGGVAPTAAEPHKPVTQFRATGVGSNRRFGAAYYPWLKTAFSYIYGLDYTEDNVSMDINADGNADTWTNLKAAADASITDEFEAKIKEVIGKLRIEMPPSPAIAGIYAAVDRTRGVWKAPANVAITNAVEPLIRVSHEDQMDMNIHSSGLSVNAIRHFTGRGTLVWGARTLEGNDNENKYVSVRRFLNMVMESVKESTEPFVFEANDANTWVKVRAMIENFLTNLWRQGALQGAKPEEAFFVNVGLGSTMTAVDILEGRMIVEVGMAIVRPAEFIIIQFSHLLAQS